MNRPTAHISIDLDTIDALLAGYGIPCPPCDRVYRVAMPRLLDLLDRVRIKATLFVIARDAEAEADLWQHTAQRGHEIASHSLTHPVPFSTLSADDMDRELRISRDHLSEVTGRPVIGFRAPGWDASRATLNAVLRAGYRYDASVMPSPALLGARILRFFLARGAARDLSAQAALGTAFSRRCPYLTEPDGGLWEFPVAVSPVFRVPFVHTLWYLAPAALCWRTYRAIRRSGVPLSYQFHATDLLGLREDGLDPRMALHPGMRLPLRRKVLLIEKILAEIAVGCQVTTFADAVGRAPSKDASKSDEAGTPE